MLAYIIYAVYNKVETSNYNASNDHSKKQTLKSSTFKTIKSTEEENAAPYTKSNALHKEETVSPLEDMVKKPGSDVGPNVRNNIHSEETNENGTISWKFLPKQHWPELLSFYHIRFNERYVLEI